MQVTNIHVGKPVSTLRSRRASVVVRCSSERLPWLPKAQISAGILAGVLLSQVGSANAASSITQQQNAEALRMQEIVQSRTGRPLTSLQSSPNVATAPSPKVRGEDADTRALLDQIESMNRTMNEQRIKANAAAEEARQLRFEKEILQKEKQAAAAAPAVTSRAAPIVVAPAPVPAPTAAPAPAATLPPAPVPVAAPTKSAPEAEEKKDGGIAGLLNVIGIFLGGGAVGYVALQKKQIEDVETNMGSQLGSERKVVEQLKSQADAVKANFEKEQSLTKSLRAELTSAKEESVKLKEVERKEKAASEAASKLAAKALEAEKVNAAAVSEVEGKEMAAAEAASKLAAKALEAERVNAAAVRRGSCQGPRSREGQRSNSQLSEAERKEKAASMLAAKALEAEKVNAAAVKKESAATEELMQSERAAKFAAEAEAKVLEERLRDATEQLKKGVASGEELSKALAETEKRVEQEAVDNAKLKSKLSIIEGQVKEGEKDRAELKGQVQQTETQVAAAKEDAMNLKTAMTALKSQAEQIAKKAQKEAAEAAAARAEAGAELSRVTSELQAAQKEVADARQEAAELDKARSAAVDRVSSLETELAAQKASNASLSSQLEALQKESVAAAEQLLGLEGAENEVRHSLMAWVGTCERVCVTVRETELAAQKASNASLSSQLEALQKESVAAAEQLLGLEGAEKEVKQLRSSLETLNTQLAKSKVDANEERGKREMVESQMNALKADYEKARAEVENARAASQNLERQAEGLKRQVAEAQASSTLMRDQLLGMHLSFNRKLSIFLEQIPPYFLRISAPFHPSMLLWPRPAAPPCCQGPGQQHRHVAEAQASSTAMRDQLVDMNLSFNQKLSMVSQEAKAAQETKAAAVRRAAEVESELESIRADVAKTVQKSESNQADLAAERDARALAENNLGQLREQLDLLLANNEGAKLQAEQQLAQLKTQFAELQRKVSKKGAAGRKRRAPEDGEGAGAAPAAEGEKPASTTKSVGSRAARKGDGVISAAKIDAAAAAKPKRKYTRKSVVASAADGAAAEAAPAAEGVKPASSTKSVGSRASRRGDEVISAAKVDAAAAKPKRKYTRKSVIASAADGDAAPAPEKRGPGRPRKNPVAEAPPAETAQSTATPGDDANPKVVKAGSYASSSANGRVIRVRLAASVAGDAEVGQSGGVVPAKRGPGRPRKVVALVEGSEGGLGAAAPAKRGPGRPRKVVADSDGAVAPKTAGVRVNPSVKVAKAAINAATGAPVKRGPAPKTAGVRLKPAVKMAKAAINAAAAVAPVKRGPGRPRKVVPPAEESTA
eukprot:gene10005-7889_t